MKKKILFVFFMIFSTYSIYAYATETLSATDSLENTLAHIQTMQADFSQTISTSTSSRGRHINQQLSGMFILKRPGKFFWQTLEPIHQDIISDGKKIWIYDKDLEQIMIKSLEENVGATPALLLNGKAGTIARDYKVKMIEKAQERLYTLIPKYKTYYHYIQMSFQGNTLTQMRFEDSLEQLTNFSFTHVKINLNLSDNLFIFIPPKGVDVLNG